MTKILSPVESAAIGSVTPEQAMNIYSVTKALGQNNVISLPLNDSK